MKRACKHLYGTRGHTRPWCLLWKREAECEGCPDRTLNDFEHGVHIGPLTNLFKSKGPTFTAHLDTGENIMILYRILTEDKNRGDVIDYVHQYFDGFTTLNGCGYWKGQAESCLIIEIITDYKHHNDILRIADYIQRHNAQESVAITVQDVEVKTVGEKL